MGDLADAKYRACDEVALRSGRAGRLSTHRIQREMEGSPYRHHLGNRADRILCEGPAAGCSVGVAHLAHGARLNGLEVIEPVLRGRGADAIIIARLPGDLEACGRC